ncbi:MAG: 16S rRNA (cytidine(1402)-2'-O)-methyltransferase [Proteobacteria bacterium]|nr:16S rRNA (cytidine(1402)-2'-O)-methyltransferase [Burkholderiales bacterium]
MHGRDDPVRLAVEAGGLYVVATPIGNLGDLSPRARAVLGAVDWIAAEDTRVTRKLFAHANDVVPRGRMLALHAHNERAQGERIVALLQSGATVALVSDAGTPAISDPGAAVVHAARDAGGKVFAVPGPNAAIAALSVSGLALDTFTFCGFLPSTGSARRSAIETLRGAPGALVFYESPHRVVECIDDLCNGLGGARPVVIARELTKLFESVHRCRLDEAAAWLAADADHRRGEFVLIVDAPGQAPAAADIETERVLVELLAELPVSRAAHVAARVCGVDRAHAYRLALALKKR